MNDRLKIKSKPARTTVARKPGVAKKARPQSGRRRRVRVKFLPGGRRLRPTSPITPRGGRRGRRDRRRRAFENYQRLRKQSFNPSNIRRRTRRLGKIRRKPIRA